MVFNQFKDLQLSALGFGTMRLPLAADGSGSIDQEELDRMVDAAMAAGANTTYGIAFSSTQANEAYQKALRRAVEDAVQKAQVLADAAGVKLGKLKSINAEQSLSALARGDLGVSNVFTYEAKAADAGTAITSGDVTVSASVVLEYEFE